MGAYFRSALLDWELIIRRSWGLNRGNTVNTKKVDLSYIRTIIIIIIVIFKAAVKGATASAINSAIFVSTFVTSIISRRIFFLQELNWVIIHII